MVTTTADADRLTVSEGPEPAGGLRPGRRGPSVCSRGVNAVRSCAVHYQSVDPGQLQAPANLWRWAAYLRPAADCPHPAHGPHDGAYPDRVDELDSAQIDRDLNARSE
jgi:hypothetical protein